jgi:hypothetical protein
MESVRPQGVYAGFEVDFSSIVGDLPGVAF